VQFLKHLSRTRLLLHLIDLAPVDGSEPAENFKLIEAELGKYSEGIADKDRWLVFTKLDALSPELAEDVISQFLATTQLSSPVFKISAITGQGTQALCEAIQTYLAERRATEENAADEESLNPEQKIRDEVHDFSSLQREKRRASRVQAQQNRDDDFDVDVHYEN